MADFVTIRELCNTLGMNKSNLIKYAKKKGFDFEKRRTADAKHQLTLTMPTEVAEQFITIRKQDGWCLDSSGVPVDNAVGSFYVIQLIPELWSGRIKMGFADSVDARLAQHKTAAPTAQLVKAWPCKRVWEQTVMDYLSAASCQLVANEVFDCDSLAELIDRGDRLFDMLPNPQSRPPLSEHSPLNR